MSSSFTWKDLSEGFPSLDETADALVKAAMVYPGCRFGRGPLVGLWKHMVGEKDCRIMQQAIAAGEKTLGDCMKKGWQQYLTGRRDTAIHTSFEVICRKNPDCRDPIDRAAVLLQALAQLYLQTFRGEIDRNPDEDRIYDLDGNLVQRYPLDMDGYRGIFSACRLPGRWEDEIRHFLLRLPRHVSVAFRGRVYLMEILDVQNDPLSAEVLAASLSDIRKSGESCPALPWPSPLLSSALDRAEWYRLRQGLMQSRQNARHLQRMESGVIHLVLSEDRPQSDAEILYCMLQKPEDAFFGKTQLRVFANGEAAFSFEHALTNGSETSCMINDRLEPLEYNVTRDWIRRGRKRAEITVPNPCLDWEIGGSTEAGMMEAQRKVQKLLGDRIMRLATISMESLWMKAGDAGARKLADWVLQISFMSALHTVDPNHGGIGIPVHIRAIGGYLDIAPGFNREVGRLAQALAGKETGLEALLSRSREQYRQMVLASKRGSGANAHLMAINGLRRGARMQSLLQRTFCFLSRGLSEVINPRSTSSNGGHVRAFTTIETNHPDRLVMGFAIDRATQKARCHFKAGVACTGRLEPLSDKMQEYLDLIVKNLPPA